MAFNLGVYLDAILLVSGVIMMLLILTYLASRVFRIQSMEVWFNVELSEFFTSFFILFFAIGFFEAANIIAISYAGGGTSAIPAASTFLKSSLDGVGRGMKDTITLQVCLSVLSTFTKRIGESVLTLTYKVFPGLDSYMGIINILFFGFTAAFGSLSVQLMLFQIIDATMIKFFLPAGILLRFFPPTRDAGIFLIAFAIGFQAVFPLTYIVNDKILKTMGFDGYTTAAYEKFSLCGGKYPLYGALGNPALWGTLGNLGQVAGSIFRSVFNEFTLGTMVPAEFSGIMNSLSELALPSLFLPALSLTITFAFINGFTKFVLMKI